MRYFLLALFAMIFFSNCRKEAIPEFNAFKPGQYFYDLNWNDSIYPNYYKLSISINQFVQNSRDKYYFFYQVKNYEISELRNDPLEYAFTYLSNSNYRLFDGGLYVESNDGFLDLSSEYFLKIPSPASGITSIDVKNCKDYPKKPKMPTTISQNKVAISYDGKTYQTYKIDVGYGMNCEPNAKHILYVDEDYGLIRYEIYELSSNTLKGTFTLRSN